MISNLSAVVGAGKAVNIHDLQENESMLVLVAFGYFKFLLQFH